MARSPQSPNEAAEPEPQATERRPRMVRPEGISDDVWKLGRVLGDTSLASEMLDVSQGKRAPKSQSETTDMMRAASKLRDRSMKRYLKLRETLQGKLDEAFAEYRKRRAAQMPSSL